MTVLEKKYGLEKDNALQMVKDGLISPTIIFHAEIYDYFNKLDKKAIDAVTDTAEYYKISERLVWTVLKKFR